MITKVMTRDWVQDGKANLIQANILHDDGRVEDLFFDSLDELDEYLNKWDDFYNQLNELI